MEVLIFVAAVVVIVVAGWAGGELDYFPTDDIDTHPPFYPG